MRFVLLLMGLMAGCESVTPLDPCPTPFQTTCAENKVLMCDPDLKWRVALDCSAMGPMWHCESVLETSDCIQEHHTMEVLQ